MADEKQGQVNNPYSISAFPFSESLQPQQYQSTAPQTVSGGGGALEGSAMIADKFLEGFSRGRKMAFDKQEQQRNQLKQDIDDARGRVEKSNLPDASDDPNAVTKQKLYGKLDALRWADVYQEVHKSKDKENPALKALKNVFDGMVGPPPNKFEFGPEQIHKTLSGIWSDMDKAQTAPQAAEKAANDLTQYYSQNYGQPQSGQQPQQSAPAQQPAQPQQQKPNILPYGSGAQQQQAQQTPPPPGGQPAPQAAAPQQAQPPQTVATTGAQQQMPTAMRQQPAPQQQAQTAPPPGAQQQPQVPPAQAGSQDVMKDPEFMKRLNRVLTLDPNNPTAKMIVNRIAENDKVRANKSLAEDIKGIPGADILEGNPNAKTAFGGPVKKTGNYVQGKDDKLYPIDAKAATKPHNLKTSWAIVEGSDDPVEVWVDPQNPDEPPRSVATGKPVENVIRTETAGEITADIRSKSYGTFGEFYRAARGLGMTNAEAMEDAGKKTYKALGIRLGRTQQEEAIDAMLTGVGAGDPFKGQVGKPAATPPVPSTPPAVAKPIAQAAPPGGQAPAPTTTKPTTATPPGAAPRPAAKPVGATAITPQQIAQTAEENKNIDIYLGDLMGTTKVSGKANVRKLAGQDALARRTGLSPSEFQAAAAVDKDKIKALSDTVERYGALQRLNSIMDRFSPNILDLAKKIPQSGSPWLNQKWRGIKLEAVGDPDIRQYLVALNDFQRQYATVTSGGGLSRAQLPVSTAENVDKIVDPNATLGEVVGLVNQIKTQAVLEQAGMKDSLDKLKGEVKDSALGRASAGQTPPPPKPKIYTQADVDAAVKDHPGLSAKDAEAAFKAKGWEKK
jgi:hypothetical protein